MKIIVIIDCRVDHFRVRWEKLRENRFSFGTQNITVKAARISVSGGRSTWGNRIIMRDVNLLGISGA